MQQKIILTYLFITMLVSKNLFSQPGQALQKTKDSIQLADLKKREPEVFRNNIIPIKLTDNSYYINGFFSALHLLYNQVQDSVYRNYHPDMPDTSTVKPYASFAVLGEHVKLEYLRTPFFTNMKTEYGRSLTAVTNTNNIDKVYLPDTRENEKINERYLIRVSLNGKVINDWKSITALPKKLCQGSAYFNNSGAGSMKGYLNVYSLCDTILKINDQLFIEVKDNSNGWLIDSYNITRVATAPKVSAIFPADKNDSILTADTPVEKKTLF